MSNLNEEKNKMLLKPQQNKKKIQFDLMCQIFLSIFLTVVRINFSLFIYFTFFNKQMFTLHCIIFWWKNFNKKKCFFHLICFILMVKPIKIF